MRTPPYANKELAGGWTFLVWNLPPRDTMGRHGHILFMGDMRDNNINIVVDIDRRDCRPKTAGSPITKEQYLEMVPCMCC